MESEKTVKECLKQKKTVLILAVVHFLTSFLFERTFFSWIDEYDLINYEISQCFISLETEKNIVYFFSKILSVVLIYNLWRTVVYFLQNCRNDKRLFFWCTIFLIVFLTGLFIYPDSFGKYQWDNYSVFLCSRRFVPTYWQGVYTGIFYAACFMTFPTPISLLFFQSLFFVLILKFACEGSSIYSGKSSGANYAVLLLFLIPDTFLLYFNSGRTSLYAILLLDYFLYLNYALKRLPEKAKLSDMVLFPLLAATVAVWRSEGILFGIVGIIIFIIALFKDRASFLKRAVSVTVVFCVSFVILFSVQNIGSRKYYGSDYKIINTTNVLCDIFNSPDNNLSFEGAEEKIQAIERVVPVEALKSGGLSGYRAYNSSMGHKSSNLTQASKEDQKDYMQAFYSIVFHNKRIYLKTQLNAVMEAFRMPWHFDMHKSNEIYEYVETPESFNSIEVGQIEILQTKGCWTWNNNAVRNAIASVIFRIHEFRMNNGLLLKIHIVFNMLVIIADLIFAILEIRTYYYTGEQEALCSALIFLTLLVELAALVAVIPEGRSEYLYSVLYPSCLMLILKSGEKRKGAGIKEA